MTTYTFIEHVGWGNYSLRESEEGGKSFVRKYEQIRPKLIALFLLGIKKIKNKNQVNISVCGVFGKVTISLKQQILSKNHVKNPDKVFEESLKM